MPNQPKEPKKAGRTRRKRLLEKRARTEPLYSSPGDYTAEDEEVDIEITNKLLAGETV